MVVGPKVNELTKLVRAVKNTCERCNLLQVHMHGEFGSDPGVSVE